ncbi:MAG: IS3 family transposase [Candidatus Limnocylindria bacterium]
MSRGRKSRFSREARAAAVSLAREPGNTFAAVARDLGVHGMTVRRWARALSAQEDPATQQARVEHAELVALRRRVRVLEEEREILGKSRGLPRSGDRADAVTVFRFIEREKAHHRVGTMCRLLDVSASGYWAWRRRGVSRRSADDAELTRRIQAAHVASRGTYGAPRIHAELRAGGIQCGRKRVARLMRRAGLSGVQRRRFVRTTIRDAAAAPAADLVGRRFTRDAPDRLWVADITYLPTAAGFLYLAAILDAWSRRVVGWAMAPHVRATLVSAALAMAVARRQPGAGLVHHSDHGVQYTSLAFGARLRQAGIAASMGSIGDAYDNAMAESFFASLEAELIDRSAWPTRDAAYAAVVDYIEAFYNPRRRHSALGYLSPVEFERRYRQPTLSA